MGRQQYLSRLALGRSAFADVEGDETSTSEDKDGSANTEPSSGQQHVQKYDSKGRPINPSTEERNTAMRDAENAALALVGVVERKDSHDRYAELKYAAIRNERETVLEAEQDAGETLELVATCLSFTNYATETLTRRIQAGLYRPSDSFASIISNGLEAIQDGGPRGAFAILFPGAPAAIFYATARVLLGATLSSGFEYFSKWLIKQKMRARTARRIHSALYFVCEALLIGLDVALLPLEYYAYAQRLGIAPTWPPLPNWRMMLPSNPTSFHQLGRHSPITVPWVNRLCSPAGLMLIQNSLWREQDSEIPVGTQLTQFEFPRYFNSPTWMVTAPKADEDPFGWVLYQGYILRTRLMRYFGYNLEYRREALTKYENDRMARTTPAALEEAPDDASTSSEDEEGDGMRHVYRSTELAHLAPRYLANRIDAGYAKLLFLPLQALVVRSVAQSYIASPLPKTTFALSATLHLYAPFAGVGSVGLLRAARWSELGSYLSKLGLSLGLHVGNSLITFFLVSSLVRWQGRRFFDWGSSGVIGGVVYPTEEEE